MTSLKHLFTAVPLALFALLALSFPVDAQDDTADSRVHFEVPEDVTISATELVDLGAISPGGSASGTGEVRVESNNSPNEKEITVEDATSINAPPSSDGVEITVEAVSTPSAWNNPGTGSVLVWDRNNGGNQSPGATLWNGIHQGETDQGSVKYTVEIGPGTTAGGPYQYDVTFAISDK